MKERNFKATLGAIAASLLIAGSIPLAKDYLANKQLDGANLRTKTSTNFSSEDVAGFYDSSNHLAKIIVKNSCFPTISVSPIVNSFNTYFPTNPEFQKYQKILMESKL